MPHNMFVMGWIILMTIPLGVIIAVVWILLEIGALIRARRARE